MLHGLRAVIQVGSKRLSLCFMCSPKPLRHQIACNICRLNVALRVSDNKAVSHVLQLRHTVCLKAPNHQMINKPKKPEAILTYK